VRLIHDAGSSQPRDVIDPIDFRESDAAAYRVLTESSMVDSANIHRRPDHRTTGMEGREPPATEN
jgi:hypothetical protein